uniref:C3H1-type domain-containing protein n=1 Tax=Tetradesmus obliquus TaxID=3088 RepID=A0A383V885_TETOB
MPHVRKADVLGVVRQLWSTGTIEDEAKLILAEQLINETWEGKKSGIPMNQAGVPVKAALGERWLGAKERMAQGKPPLGVFLAEDPYFILKDMGGSHLHVQLRVSRLAQLIGNAELISQYRNSASSSGPGSSSSSSSSTSAAAGSSSSSAAAGGRQGRVQMNSEGLPLRPGVAPCQHYLKHGWCIFKQDCWYNHPERPGKRKAAPASPANPQQQRTFFTESHLEPGVMLRNGVNPVRPGVRPCQHYLRQGWCVFKAKCRNDHPDLTDAAGSSSSSAARAAAASPQPQDGPEESLVRQPPQQLLLGLLIDSLWPPRASKDNYVKGQIARHIIVTLASPGDVTQENKTFDIGGAGVGNFVNRWWPSQSLYDPAASKPYASLKALLGGDPYFRVWMAGNVPMVTLLYGKLIEDGGDAAAERLAAMADAVWLPTAGKEVWLHGCLAKWLHAGFKGCNESRKVVPMTHAAAAAAAAATGKEVWLRGCLAKWLLNAGFKGRNETRKMLPMNHAAAAVAVAVAAGNEVWLRGCLAKWLLHAGFKGRDETRKVLPLTLAASIAAAAAPTACVGKEVWLRGCLAKWLLNAGFKGHNEGRKVLPRVLAEGPEQPTVFCMDMAQAGEYLLRCWRHEPHPYDAESAPWSQLKPLIAGDRFLYIEQNPRGDRFLYIEQNPRGAAGSQHVTLDVADLLTNFAAAARAARRAQHGGGSYGGVPAGEGVINVEDDDSDDDDITELSLLGTAAWAAAAGQISARSSSSGSSSNLTSPQQRQQQQQRPASAASPASRGVVSPAGGGPADVASAAADLAALEAMHYEPPDNMQWWWPEHKPEKHNCCWTEIAIRLLDPAAEEFELQLAEMVQHLEISAVLGMACATYKSHPHLLQFFAPHAAIGGLEMPSAVYLLDVMRPGRRVAEVLDLVGPVLASQQNTKVCHGSKLWSGQLEKAYNIRLVNYFDTQQAHHVYNVLRHEAGRSPLLNGAALKATAEVSLSALLRTHDLYHPVRHTESGKEAVKLWQDRPLSAELVTCAAADVAYLIPLMELQLRQLRTAAGEVRQQQQQQRPGSRAAALLSSLPPELSEPTTLAAIAAGAEAARRGGGLSYDRLRAIGGLEAFHQAPLHALGLQLGQSYGAVRGRPTH